MKARPILFSSPMVRAILAGDKTQTRRVIRLPKSKGEDRRGTWEASTIGGGGCFDRVGKPVSERVCIWNNRVGTIIVCPYGQPGHVLWVRETFCLVNDNDYDGKQWIDYRATPKYSDVHPAGWDNEPDHPDALKWKPSIFMPRLANRITLEITDIRVERLQAISETDALAEGVVKINKHYLMDPDILNTPVKYSNLTKFNDEKYWGNDNPVGAFATFFERINGPDSWTANPWVWVVEFIPRLLNVDDYLKARAA